MIVHKISLNKVEQISFHTFKSSFIKRLRSKNFKSKYLLLFLQETKYVNKVIYSYVKFYISK